MNLAAILIDKKFAVQEKLQYYFELTYNKIKKITGEIYFLSEKPDIHINNSIEIISFNQAKDFLSFLNNNLSNKSIILLNAYSPLLDLESTQKMIEEHKAFAFDYTFPENLPLGLLPEIIESDAAGFINHTIPEKQGMFNENIKELFERDVSSYDCNIFISPSRLINYRINFIPDNYNDYLIIGDIISNQGNELSHLKLEELIKKNPELIRKRPTYYEIELNTERESGSFYISDRLERKSEMNFDYFKKTIEQISKFSYNPVVSIGLFGEPFLYSLIKDVIKELKKIPNVQFIFESRCLFSNIEAIQDALVLPNVKIVFDISSSKPETFAKYKKSLNSLIPFEGLSVMEEKIKQLNNKEKIYIQFTRTTDNENELMRFYEKWRDFSDRIIIKKPDTFGGILDSCQVVDLSPVKRFPCLHLKHDMVILSDGKIPLCRQDYNAKYSAGNILTDGIETCWNKMNDFYQNQWKEIYNKPPLCEKCDEWWVFNL